jgi:hypothetical protein
VASPARTQYQTDQYGQEDGGKNPDPDPVSRNGLHQAEQDFVDARCLIAQKVESIFDHRGYPLRLFFVGDDTVAQ